MAIGTTFTRRLLADIASNTASTCAQRAERLSVTQKSIYTGMWELRTKALLDRHNVITDAGRERLAEAAQSDESTQNVEQRPFRLARFVKAPTRTTAIVEPRRESRTNAGRDAADSVIANAKNSARVLRAYLVETAEITQLLDALLTQLDGSLTLIEQTYQAAAR